MPLRRLAGPRVPDRRREAHRASVVLTRSCQQQALRTAMASTRESPHGRARRVVTGPRAPARGLALRAESLAGRIARGAKGVGIILSPAFGEGGGRASARWASLRVGAGNGLRRRSPLTSALTQSRDEFLARGRLRTGCHASCRFTTWGDERGDNSHRQPQLHVRREPPGAVPAETVMKELPATRAQKREDVLEIGGGARRSSERRRIERASPRGEDKDPSHAACDLEAARAEVLVRQAVAREVEDRPQKERRRSGPARRAGGSARGHVKRDDDDCLPSRHHQSERRPRPLARSRPRMSVTSARQPSAPRQVTADGTWPEGRPIVGSCLWVRRARQPAALATGLDVEHMTRTEV